MLWQKLTMYEVWTPICLTPRPNTQLAIMIALSVIGQASVMLVFQGRSPSHQMRCKESNHWVPGAAERAEQLDDQVWSHTMTWGWPTGTPRS